MGSAVQKHQTKNHLRAVAKDSDPNVNLKIRVMHAFKIISVSEIRNVCK